ncbi:MAG: hypothetical protein J2P32_00880 [Actinobacteria bacterium]|nr:hypothetical protein [Actinomycetota bacterium]
MRDPELREQLRSTLNGGKKTGWNDDEPAVIEAGCELAVRLFFPEDYDIRTITAFVSELRVATGNYPPLDQLKGEAIIRSALGEADVVIGDLTPAQKLNMRIAVTALVTGKLGLDEAAIDQLIADSERIAFDRGWHPPLAN